MRLIRTRTRHGADLAVAHAPRRGPGAYLGGVRAELSAMEKPNAGAVLRGTALVIGLALALGVYLKGCDRVVAALIGFVF